MLHNHLAFAISHKFLNSRRVFSCVPHPGIPLNRYVFGIKVARVCNGLVPLYQSPRPLWISMERGQLIVYIFIEIVSHDKSCSTDPKDARQGTPHLGHHHLGQQLPTDSPAGSMLLHNECRCVYYIDYGNSASCHVDQSWVCILRTEIFSLFAPK